MNTNGITKRFSVSRKQSLILSAVLALAGCADSAIGADGLDIPTGHPGSESAAISQHDGTERGGMLLAAAPAAVEPDSHEAQTALIASEVEEPALEAAPQLADSADEEVVADADEEVVADADESEESDVSGASRTEAEMQVATQSFSAGDPLEFGTHTQLAPVGLVADGAEPYFGYPVLVQGDRMLVGAWADAEQAPGQGAAFVFERNMAGVWEQDIKLMASDADVEPTEGSWGASFGYTMSMDGDTLAIGAAWDDGDNGELDAGAVYIYELISDAWVQTKLRCPEQAAFETFGDALEVSGDWLFVHGRDEGNHAVHVYHRVDHVWTFTQMLTSPDASNEQYEFGLSLASGGDTLFVSAVRAPGGTTNWDETEYSVYVYTQSGGTWSVMPVQQLAANGNAEADGFGVLAFDGSTLVVGAPYASGTAAYDGAAYVFENDGDSWEQVAAVTPTSARAGGYFGYSVAVDGDSFAVGTAFGDSADSISVYERELEAWTHNQSVTNNDIVEGYSGTPFFGLYGGQLFVGLPHAKTDGATVGAVYALTGPAI